MVSVEPLVAKHLIDGQALGWLLFKQSREQVFCLLAESCCVWIAGQIEWLVEHAISQILARFFPKRKFGGEERVHESTEAVHVNSAVVALASEDLRGDVSLGAHIEVCSCVGRRQLNCATKVAKLE